MDQHMFLRAEPWAAGALALLVAAGCVFDAETGTGGAGGAGGDTGSGFLGGTDAQVCGAACDMLIGCGVELDQLGCKESCLDPASTGLVACFRQVTAACDPLASCVLAAVCGPGGVPSGSSSCEGGQGCFLSCAGSSDVNCGCACMAPVAPVDAAAIYAVTVCASVHCNFECAVNGGDPGSCQSCIALDCEAADLQCQ
jgi:hypothetical protein